MAKVNFIGIVESATGKVCTHSDVSFVHRKKSGKTFTCRRDQKSDKAPTSGQLMWRQEFGKRQIMVNNFIENLGAMKADELKAKQEASKYETLRSFVYAHIDWEAGAPYNVIVGGINYGAATEPDPDGAARG